MTLGSLVREKYTYVNMCGQSSGHGDREVGTDDPGVPRARSLTASELGPLVGFLPGQINMEAVLWDLGPQHFREHSLLLVSRT